MNCLIKLGLLLIGFVPILGFTAPSANGDSWQCISRDSSKQEWTANNAYQKVAMNLAFDACKKQSTNPKTCKASEEDCEGFHLGLSTRPYWYCVALDEEGSPWKSSYYRTRDDAAMAAKDYCRNNSSAPETCYMDFVTCININQR